MQELNQLLTQKTQPYCTEFGNKEAVRCEWDDPELADKKNQISFYDDNAISLPSYRACPRVKTVERARFIKFEVSYILNCKYFITVNALENLRVLT